MTQRTTLAVRRHSIFMLFSIALTLLAANTFAQDTAYVPFIVNTNATVKAQQGAKSVSKNFTANTLDTLFIITEGGTTLASPGKTQKPVAMYSSRGKLSLELSPQFYKNAEISLYSLNGKRVLHDRVSASSAAKNISHSNVATGVYVLYIKENSNTFSTRLAHHGGGMNIDVSFGGVFSPLKKDDAGAFGTWDITVSAAGYIDSAYALNIDIGLNPTQDITLLGISLSSSSVEEIPSSSSSVETPSSSSSDDADPSSSSVDEPSSSSGDNGDSSSSVETPPKCGETEYDPETQFCINDALLDIHEDCVGFENGTTREHYGKDKKQFCDIRDGKKYVYVDIGEQTWMAENLNYSGEDGTMGRCFRDDPENCETLGRMYNLDEMFCEGDSCSELQWGVTDPKDHKISMGCPIGWHLPNTTELEELLIYSDPNFTPGSENTGRGNNSAATKLRVTSTDGTDEFGFSALPGGFCGGGCPALNPRWTTLYSATLTDPIRSTFWWSHGYGAPVPLAKSWHISTVDNGSQVPTTWGGVTAKSVDDAYQSYSTSRFYTRCLKDKAPIAKTPEPAPAPLTCSGSGTTGQKCHYGEWKDYFTDERDGKEYAYVKIGEQTWMAENLNYSGESGTIGKCYNDIEDNCNVYGRLYNYAAAVSETDAVCPSGWRLPTDAEWRTLTTDVGGTGTNNLVGATAALKAKSGWNIENSNGTYGINGTDDYGFAALPGSYGNFSAGNFSELNSEGIVDFASARGGFWWTNGGVAANGAQIRHIGPTLDDVTRIDNDKSRMYSVRCIQDFVCPEWAKGCVGDGSATARLFVRWDDGIYDNVVGDGPLLWIYRFDPNDNSQNRGIHMIYAVAKADSRFSALVYDTGNTPDNNGNPLGVAVGGLGYAYSFNPGVSLLSLLDDYGEPIEEYIMPNANGLFVTNSYNFDNYINESIEDHWFSGWYYGYWSYWVAENYKSNFVDYTKFGYSNWGASTRQLTDGSADCWDFLPLDGEYQGGSDIQSYCGQTN